MRSDPVILRLALVLLMVVLQSSPAPSAEPPGAVSGNTSLAGSAPWTAAALHADGDLVVVGCHSGVYLFSARSVLKSSGFNTTEVDTSDKQPLEQSFVLDWISQSVRIPSQLDYIHDVAFDSNGELLAIAGGTPGQYGQIEIYALARAQANPEDSIASDTHRFERLAVLSEHDDVVMSVSWAGKQLYSAGYDGKVTVFRPSNDERPDHWDKLTQAQLSNRPLTAIRILERDNRRLCVVAGLDQTIQIYAANPESLSRPIRTLNNHVAPILDLAVIAGKNADEPFLMASASEDRTVRFWNPETGRLLRFARLDQTPLCLGLARMDDRLLCLAGTTESGDTESGPEVIDVGTAARHPANSSRGLSSGGLLNTRGQSRCSVCLPVSALRTAIFGQRFPELRARSIQTAP